MNRWIHGEIAVGIIAAVACAARGAEPRVEERDRVAQGSVEIQADRFERDPETRRLLAEGNVLAVWDGQRVECERVEWLPPDRPDDRGRFVYEGKVRVTIKQGGPKRATPEQQTAEGWRGTCGRAEHDPATDRIEMKKGKAPGRPKLWRGRVCGEADTIVVVPRQWALDLIGNPNVQGGSMLELVGGDPSVAKELERRLKEIERKD